MSLGQILNCTEDKKMDERMKPIFMFLDTIKRKHVKRTMLITHVYHNKEKIEFAFTPPEKAKDTEIGVKCIDIKRIV